MDPDLIEGMVLLESAGRPDAQASTDLESAAGLTQILAQTATGLLGMKVDVAASERLTRKLGRARGPRQAARIRAQRARVDERFDPAKALAATGRYLKQAKDEFGREDLAVVSYHMGIGNLQSVLGAYGDDGASYAQLYFDASPDSHARAYRLLYGLGDDSKTYYWRVLASREVMRLYRDDRSELERLAELQAGASSGELVLHPDGAADDTEPGALRPEANALLAYIRHGVTAVSGVRRPLRVIAEARLRLRRQARLRERRPGPGVPVHARPPPGAEPDRLGARRHAVRTCHQAIGASRARPAATCWMSI